MQWQDAEIKAVGGLLCTSWQPLYRYICQLRKGVSTCPPPVPLHRDHRRLRSGFRKQRALPCPVNGWAQSPFIPAQGVLGVLFFLARQTGMHSHTFPGQTQKRNICKNVSSECMTAFSPGSLLPWDLTSHRNWLWFGANTHIILYFKTF